MRRLAPLLIAGPLALLLCCSDESTNPDDDHEGAVGDLYSYSYSGSAPDLTVVRPFVYCSGSELVTGSDTVAMGATAVDSLLVLAWDDTLLRSSAVVRVTQQLRRRSGGPGLEGDWELVSDGRAIASGTPDQAEGVALAMDSTLADSMASRGGLVVSFTANRMSARYTGSLAGLLLPFVFADAPLYLAVGIDTSADGRSVAVTGSVTHEVVTITFDGMLNQMFGSSQPASHPAYAVWRVPQECRQDNEWFGRQAAGGFLWENSAFSAEFIAAYIEGQGLPAVLDIAYEARGYDTVSVSGNISGEAVIVSYQAGSGVTFHSNRTVAHPDTLTSREPMVPPWWWAVFCNENTRP